jgi:chromosome segregation ATPase
VYFYLVSNVPLFATRCFLQNSSIGGDNMPKKLDPESETVRIHIQLTRRQLEHCKKQGNIANYLRQLIDSAMKYNPGELAELKRQRDEKLREVQEIEERIKAIEERKRKQEQNIQKMLERLVPAFNKYNRDWSELTLMLDHYSKQTGLSRDEIKQLVEEKAQEMEDEGPH